MICTPSQYYDYDGEGTCFILLSHLLLSSSATVCRANCRRPLSSAGPVLQPGNDGQAAGHPAKNPPWLMTFFARRSLLRLLHKYMLYCKLEKLKENRFFFAPSKQRVSHDKGLFCCINTIHYYGKGTLSLLSFGTWDRGFPKGDAELCMYVFYVLSSSKNLH